MKAKTTLTALLFLLILGIGKAQKQEIFYDQNGKEITKKKQSKILRKKFRQFITAVQETENTIESRLIERRKQSTLNEAKKHRLTQFIEELIASKIPEDYITIILFHQGKDECNSTGRATPESCRFQYNNFKAKVLQEGKIIQFNIYKSNEGLEKYSLDRRWYADKDQVIEKTFFEYQYPCGAYVVFDTKGNYIAYYGEYDMNTSIEDARSLKQLK